MSPIRREDAGPADRPALRRAGQFVRYLPGVAAGIGEGECAHTPVTVRRAAEYRHLMLIQLAAHCVHVLDEDDELSDALLRQGEYVAYGPSS